MVKLTIKAQKIKFSHKERKNLIFYLNITMNFHLRKDFLKTNQIEINKEYAYISVKFQKKT